MVRVIRALEPNTALRGISPVRRAILNALTSDGAAAWGVAVHPGEPPGWGPGRGRSGAVLEAPALVTGLDDLAVMGEPVEQRGRHLRVAEDAEFAGCRLLSCTYTGTQTRFFTTSFVPGLGSSRLSLGKEARRLLRLG
jgi:hypothetical protein